VNTETNRLLHYRVGQNAAVSYPARTQSESQCEQTRRSADIARPSWAVAQESPGAPIYVKSPFLRPRFLSAVRLRGELFSSTFTYGVTAFIRLASSLVLTRLLDPAAYGIFGILISLLFIIELVSDVGVTALLVRHPRGREPRFVHTIWTVRLIRSFVNLCVMFFGAHVLAYLYHAPLLVPAVRLLSLQFPISGLESMSFVIAQRDRRARIANYADMLTSAAMTVFVISLAATILRSYYVLIWGTLLRRLLLTVSSHFFYRDIGVGIAFDREAIAEQFRFARFVTPSSIVTVLLSQYDRIVLLRLFNFSLLGVYTIASSMLSPVTGIIVHNAQVILYARCAEYFRSDRASAATRYYRENRRLLLLAVILPAALSGMAQPLVSVLYDARYAGAGAILMILGLGGIATAFLDSSQNLLVASGKTHLVLVGNVIRLVTIVPLTLAGYYFFGVLGFIWFGQISILAVALYFLYEQHRSGLLRFQSELSLVGTSLVVFGASWLLGHLLLAIAPARLLHLQFRGHKG